MTVDEADHTSGMPIFFGGISVYLEQEYPWFSKTPAWLRRMLASPRLLKLVAGRAASTRASELGAMTLSMLDGEEGKQAKELDELVDWLVAHEPPDIVFLSNALLIGFARQIRQRLKCKVVCMLQGEDHFLDALPEPYRAKTWRTIAERTKDVDLLIAPSKYFGDLMSRRLGLPEGRVQVVHNGIDPNQFEVAPPVQREPVVGYFARMCPEKGLNILVDAFILLRQRGRIPGVKLKIGGGLGPSDVRYVEGLKARLIQAGAVDAVEFHPNLDKTAKSHFFSNLSVFSVPATYSEAFGLYVVEAWAAAVPTVLPDHSAFPELTAVSGGGLICRPQDPSSLADALESVLSSPQSQRTLADAARRASLDYFHQQAMAERMLEAVSQRAVVAA
jgi:glycosyltransferase involved in cell wall biosynthesis